MTPNDFHHVSLLPDHTPREAQLDARERLLKELANNATSMQNASQAEMSKLSGLLQAMDQLSRGMRTGQTQEADRLRAEQQRLAAQVSRHAKVNI